MKRIPLVLMAFAALGLVGVATVRLIDVAVADSGVTKAGAEEQTVTFVVDKMTCAMCPITVRKAMKRVKGVTAVSVDFDAKTATVVFDPAIATPEQIAKASENAGYPARPAM